MPYVTFNGLQYHYSAELPGGGVEPKQAIVFIHGSGGSHVNWKRQIKELGREYIAIAVDLPGHGLSGGSPCYSIDDYTGFMKTFSDKVVGFPFFMAGHSMGGAVALNFALNYPEMLTGLVLIGTGARLKVLPSILESFKNGAIPDNMPSFLYKPGTPEEILSISQEELKKSGPEVMFADMSACDNFDVRDRLCEIDVHSIIITGEKDVMTPIKYGKYLADNMKNSSFEIIEDAGHMSMLEKPGSLNTIIYEFMKKHS
ncbi:MAG: alpha/beta fold hydrolase [Bacillota bacterium]